MNRTNQPAYWQLDLFTLLMIGLMFLSMQIPLSSQWTTVVDIAWGALVVAGMAVWVWINWAALQQEEQEQRANLAHTSDSAPTVDIFTRKSPEQAFNFPTPFSRTISLPTSPVCWPSSPQPPSPVATGDGGERDDRQ